MGRNVQALKIAGFLDAFASDLNDELTVMINGLFVLVESDAVQRSPHLLELVQMMSLAASKSAYRTRQAALYATAKRKGA